MTSKNNMMSKFLLAGASVLLLAACTTTPVYQQRTASGLTGYSDQQIAANRYQVTYRGSSLTSRETVEEFLLRRAAEVTLQAGYSHFMFDTRSTEARTRYSSFSPRWGFGVGFGYPSYYWGACSPLGYDPFHRDYIDSDTRYQAYAEIVLLRAPQAVDEPKALEAQDVLARLNAPLQRIN